MAKKIGRPTKYSNALADRICEQVAHGKTIRTICIDEDMPTVSTIFQWLLKYKYFSEQYARAREIMADILFDEILDIADNNSKDTEYDYDGNERPNREWMGRSKLKVDTRKWLLTKIAPKKYGDRLQVDQKTELSGEVNSNVIIKINGIKKK